MNQTITQAIKSKHALEKCDSSDSSNYTSRVEFTVFSNDTVSIIEGAYWTDSEGSHASDVFGGNTLSTEQARAQWQELLRKGYKVQ